MTWGKSSQGERREGVPRRPSWPARGALGLLHAYKRWISPLLPRACRFTPTCSEYARLAILEHGVMHGGWRALLRILRCQPFVAGGVDLAE